MAKQDLSSLYVALVDDIEKEQGGATGLDSALPEVSAGMLAYDIVLGIGLRPAWYTNFGPEQSAKTTGALTMAAHAVLQGIPVVQFEDFEGCFTADTYLRYSDGKYAKLRDLFDLYDAKHWAPRTWPGQLRKDIDTLDPERTDCGTSKRKGALYYRGRKPTTRVMFSTGHQLTGYKHIMFVLKNGRVEEKLMEALEVGESVLVDREFLKERPEVWSKVKGFGKVIASRYEVSTHGRVRSVDLTVDTSRTLASGQVISYPRDITGKVLSPGRMSSGHLTVTLCDGKVQRPTLVHRIVARTFLGKAPKSKPLVLHWDDDSTNNHVENLRYGNDQDNTNDRIARGRVARGAQASHSNFTNDEAEEIYDQYQNGVSIEELQGIYASTKDTYHRRGYIRNLCLGESWLHLQTPSKPFDVTPEIMRNFSLASVVSVESTGKRERVYDVSLRGTSGDILPHSIITNGIVTHNSTGTSPQYVASIFHSAGVKLTLEEIFGKKDKNGKWKIHPRVRYHAETVAERFFDRLHSLLKRLPDKKCFNGKWYLIFPDDKAHSQYKDRSDSSMAKKYGKGIYLPVDDGKLQAVVITDSYPGMNPQSNDEEDENGSLALQARMFSKQFPRVKGRLSNKMVAVIGVNQLRQAPMVRYGPPDYEPGGQALRFNSDCRMRHTPRALSGVDISPKPKPNPDDNGTEREPSVEYPECYDIYRYVQIKADKNKLWTPKRKAWLRIWQEDGSGKARGLDPVFDVWQYLVTTNQAHGGKKNALHFNLHKVGEGKRTISWIDLKRWVLGSKEDKIAVCKKLGYSPMDLKKFCFKQLGSGEGESLYVKRLQQKKKKDKEEE